MCNLESFSEIQSHLRKCIVLLAGSIVTTSTKNDRPVEYRNNDGAAKYRDDRAVEYGNNDRRVQYTEYRNSDRRVEHVMNDRTVEYGSNNDRAMEYGNTDRHEEYGNTDRHVEYGNTDRYEEYGNTDRHGNNDRHVEFEDNDRAVEYGNSDIGEEYVNDDRPTYSSETSCNNSFNGSVGSFDDDNFDVGRDTPTYESGFQVASSCHNNPAHHNSHLETLSHNKPGPSYHQGQHGSASISFHPIQHGSSSFYLGQNRSPSFYPSQHRLPSLYPGQDGTSFRYDQPHFFPLHPDQVVNKYLQLKIPAKMSTLAVKLARESFFGEETMGNCTPQGKSDHDGLPKAQLLDLKLYLVQLFPSVSKPEFEGYWKTCLNSIGQACKAIRKKKCK